MFNKKPPKLISTNDKIIRNSLRKILDKKLIQYKKMGHNAEIFEELGIKHGMTRIDIAVINGIMCGYEIKSDKDKLDRLPEQVEEFSTVFDQLTLVVGKRHLYKAMHIIPDWWGVVVAKINGNQVIFQTIREPENNASQLKISVARLLWRNEALQILENSDSAHNVRYKSREIIYEKLASMSDLNTLKKQVSDLLITREGWRSDQQLMSNDG